MKRILIPLVFPLLLAFFDGSAPNITTLANDIITEYYMTDSVRSFEDSGGNIETETLDKAYKHYISWPFNTYVEPDFMAEKTGSYLPQSVNVINIKNDGWALIETYKGAYWAYLKENRFFLDRSADLYDSIGDEISVGTIEPQIIEISEQRGNWLLIKTWLGEKWINLMPLRSSVRLNVPPQNQWKLGYPTGCEIVSLYMMINYGAEVDIDILVSQMPYSNDPKKGFRGNPTTTRGFTVFPSALQDLTKEYLGSEHDMSGGTMDDLKQKLNSDAPVIVWFNGLGFNIHSVCLTGYDNNGFYYNDPWSGRKDVFITYASFYKIWNTPVYDTWLDITYPSRMALSYYP